MVFICSIDGLFKIYTANPATVIDLTSATVNANVRVNILFNKSRLIAWGADDDPTGLLFSKVDRDSNYTSVSGESVGALGSTTYSGTLANHQVFGVLITDGAQTVTDDKNGNLIGDGTGTINYATGAYSVIFDNTTTGAVTADYLHEDPLNGGLADFTYSATRLAGEGNIQRQDSVGSVTRSVAVFDDKYFSFQDKGSWKVTINGADDNWDNQIYRRELGAPTAKASVGTANGIVFVDTYDAENPKLKILRYDLNNELIIPATLSEDKNGVGFKMNDYEFDQAVTKKFGDLIVISCRTSGSAVNNKTILFNTQLKCFDVLENGYNFFTVSENKLWGGDSSSPNVYEILSGWDDLEYNIEGEWESGDDRLDTEQLKKVKRFQVEGYIGLSQSFEVYTSFDGDSYELLGSLSGSSDAERGVSIMVGAVLIGDEKVGGGEEVEAYHYKKEFKIHTPKFQRRKIKIVPTGLGYLDIRMTKDSDIRLKGHKLPKKYRVSV